MPTLKAQAVSCRKIFIATPCYGGMVSQHYLTSLLALTQALTQRNIGWRLSTKGNESLISRARNTLVAEFLGHTDCDYLLFIDADLGFKPETCFRLLDYNQPVVAARVPMKGLDWKQVLKAKDNCQTAQDLERAAVKYNINCNSEDNLPLEVNAEGFAKVETVGCAFMLIKREVFELMRTRLPEAQYVNDIAGYDNEFTHNNFWLFFETMKHPQSGRYLSEDYGFCYRWRKLCGGEVYADMKAEVKHIGNYNYQSLP